MVHVLLVVPYGGVDGEEICRGFVGSVLGGGEMCSSTWTQSIEFFPVF
ncbi:hypothetical protein ACP70R_047609 [Stipagrostis hirtigluma subsp. patula]